MGKININESFNLIEAYDFLLESQGVIDGCDELFEAIHSYIVKVFKYVDTVFMTNPII